MNQDIFTKSEKELLNKMDITDIEQLITHYPFRYENISKTPYSLWNIDDKVYIEGKVITSIKSIRRSKLTISRFDIINDDDVFHITIFNRPWLNNLKLNTQVTIYGKYDGHQKITAIKYNLKPLDEQLGIVPVYNLKNKINQNSFIKIIKKVLSKYNFDNVVPLTYRQKYRLIDRKLALYKIHCPNNEQDIHQAQRHLKYEEFLKFQMIISARRSELLIDDQRYQKKFNVDEIFSLANNLGFILTNDQLKAINDIVADLASNKPMYRLIQGDVGCGKTVVAALGMYGCYLAGYQSAFMAPTEVLAKQQYDEFKKLFKHTNMNIEVLYSSLPQSEKTNILERLRTNKIDLIVGTHSLIQDAVLFNNLGMIVTDEQHRFGVGQRRKLIDKGNFVDILIMSATPIPRTLTNVLYGDMDVSNIFTLPKGRKPVITKMIKENTMISILDEVLTKIDNGSLCYIVCPAIEDDNDLGVRNTTAIYKALKKELNDRYDIGMLHGKMDSSIKDKTLKMFKEKKIQILVTTTVVEVGVNIKEANIMVIYDANRFGLSQLHQLRGRIKRSDAQGYCYLLTDTKEELSIQRLQVLVNSDDGFKIAEEDLRLRGPGDLFGTRQSGLPSLILGNLITDANIIKVAKEDAEEIMRTPNEDNEVIRKYAQTFLQNNDFID